MSAPLPLTDEEFKQALPDKARKALTPQVIAQINQALSDPDAYESYRENLLSYTHVMQEGKFRLSQYVDAVRYVSYRLMGKNEKTSYELTFPDRMARHIANNTEEKDIASYITAFNKSKLVSLIMEQTMVPTWILNQDLYQQALNTQAELMLYAKSEKVRSDAADSVMRQLKPPETSKIELDVTTKDSNNMLAGLREVMGELVTQQKSAMQAGITDAATIARTPIVIDQEADA